MIIGQYFQDFISTITNLLFPKRTVDLHSTKAYLLMQRYYYSTHKQNQIASNTRHLFPLLTCAACECLISIIPRFIAVAS